jgi:hypothetical protein
MHGKVTGDVFRFEWVEHRIGAVGPSASSNGHGYFRYSVPPGDHVEHEIKGEWGLGMSDAGQTWEAIRQRNQQPDPDSVMPDEHQRVETSEWDSAPKAPAKSDDEGGEESPEDADDWE